MQRSIIHGIGTDVVFIPRIARLMGKYGDRFIKCVFFVSLTNLRLTPFVGSSFLPTNSHLFQPCQKINEFSSQPRGPQFLRHLPRLGLECSKPPPRQTLFKVYQTFFLFNLLTLSTGGQRKKHSTRPSLYRRAPPRLASTFATST